MGLEMAKASHIAERVYSVLLSQGAIEAGARMWVWPRPDRVVCIVDSTRIRNIDRLFSERTAHHLRTALLGRRVVMTNTRGAFIQVAYDPEPARAPVELRAVDLDLMQQPTALHVPLGTTEEGPLWLSITEMDSVLIGGPRRMGKSRLLHAWIRALARGQAVKLLLWDGKDGAEFERYAAPGVEIVRDLSTCLPQLLDELRERGRLFKRVGVSSLPEYNRKASDQVQPVVLILDEVAFVPDAAQPILVDLVARAGAFGLHPVFATQRPDSKSLQALLRANLSTRIAFPVVSTHDSMVILGASGAQRLPKIKGRMLVGWDARFIEVQAFRVSLDDAQGGPGPTAQADVPQLAAGLTRLSPSDADMVRIAVEECHGYFNIKRIALALKLDDHVVNAAAQRLELAGLLTEIKTNSRGHRVGRQVTETLAEMARFGRRGD